MCGLYWPLVIAEHTIRGYFDFSTEFGERGRTICATSFNHTCWQAKNYSSEAELIAQYDIPGSAHVSTRVG